MTTAGSLFSWGWDSLGQLGHRKEEDCSAPRLVQALKDVPIVRSAESCQHTSLALSQSGEMWSWGCGRALGCSGIDWDDDENDFEGHLLPQVIDRGELPPGASILRIATGGHKAACGRADGATLSWGEGEGSEPGTTRNTPAQFFK